jgi:hypothetical protein
MEVSLKQTFWHKRAINFLPVVFCMKRILTVFLCIIMASLFVGMIKTENNPIKIGNPTLTRFPISGDPRNSLARTIWDMYFFNGKIYIGSGDYWNNTGASDIWTYDEVRFVKDYTVDDEMVYNFFEFDNKLFVPGNDATESWDFANMYINDPRTGWLKHRSLTKGLHSWDCCFFKTKLYASITNAVGGSSTLVSADLGENFTEFIPDKTTKMVAFDSFMFLEAYDTTYYKFDGSVLNTVTPNLYPGYALTKSMDRYIRFRDGVLYIPARGLGRLKVDEKIPLFFLPQKEIKNGGQATKVEKFSNDTVRDIVVRDKTCYVMTAKEVKRDISYNGKIYSSSDLVNWTMESDFIVPGIPTSFEIMNNQFYIGLGARLTGSEPTTVGPESGSIWKISLLPTTGTGIFTSTPPGATVSLEGINRGITPLTLSLSPQSYTATFTLSGYQPETKTFVITAGTEVPVHAVLTLLPTTGTGIFTSTPPGATVSLEGINRGITPLTLSLSPQSYTATFTLSGYQPETKTFVITAGTEVPVHAVLSANPDPSKQLIIIKLAIGSNLAAITRNGKMEYASLDLPPFTLEGRTMVPLRFIAESFGAEVKWIEDSNNSGEGAIIIILNKSDKSKIVIKMHSLDKKVIIERYGPNSNEPDRKQYEMDVYPYIVRPANRTVVPLRFITEGFGSTVNWIPEKKEIEIKYLP